MKLTRTIAGIILASFVLLIVPLSVRAQAEPPADSTPAVVATALPAAIAKGEVTGQVVNQNDANKALGELSVGLHILDDQLNSIGQMVGTTAEDGSFAFVDVPFEPGLGYGVTVAYEGTTYFSQVGTAAAGETSVRLELAVYESTPDLTGVEVEQMHVLFNFASDGMEVQEVYFLSNLGDRTVKDGIDIPNASGVKAAVQFALPENAQYVTFQPQTNGRFYSFPGGFADAAPIIPGRGVTQIVAGYIIPYEQTNLYTLQPTLAVRQVNFVVPEAAGITLSGEGLSAPEQNTARDGQQYALYRLENIPAGKSVVITLQGDPVIPEPVLVETPSTPAKTNQLPLFIGLGILGVVLVGGGVFWWARSGDDQDDEEDEASIEDEELEGEVSEEDRPAFEALLTEIAQLDQAHDAGEVEDEQYAERRSAFIAKARAYLIVLKEEAGER